MKRHGKEKRDFLGNACVQRSSIHRKWKAFVKFSYHYFQAFQHHRCENYMNCGITIWFTCFHNLWHFAFRWTLSYDRRVGLFPLELNDFFPWTVDDYLKYKKCNLSRILQRNHAFIIIYRLMQLNCMKTEKIDVLQALMLTADLLKWKTLSKIGFTS